MNKKVRFPADGPNKNDLLNSAKSKLISMKILAKNKQYTDAIYLGGLCLEIWAKYKICDSLKIDSIPDNLFIHDLKSLIIFTGKYNNISQIELTNFDQSWSMSMRYDNPVKTKNDYDDFIKLFRTIKSYLK